LFYKDNQVKNKIIRWLQSKFHFVLRNDRDLKELIVYRFTNIQFIFISIILLIFLFLLSFYISTTVLRFWFDPRFAEQLANQQVINLSKSVDSLIDESLVKDNYINNIKSILLGKDDQINSSVNYNTTTDSLNVKYSLNQTNEIDSVFRRQFEELNNDFLIRNIENNFGDILNINLFSPVSNGIISSKYDINNKHYGVDILCNKDEPIKSIADGTVIISSWTQDSGYVISIYHSNNLVSIYKHNSKLLKTVGDKVSSGDIISIVGNTGEFTSGPHLHLELWFNGKSLNPLEFISF